VIFSILVTTCLLALGTTNVSGEAPVSKATFSGPREISIQPGDADISLGAGDHLKIHIVQGASVTIGHRKDGRPELLFELNRAAEEGNWVEAGRFRFDLGFRGRMHIRTGAPHGSPIFALLIRCLDEQLLDPAPSPREDWHVLTILEKNQLSDLDSRYWLGVWPRTTDRIQFTRAELESAGLGEEQLLGHRLVKAGVSGDGVPVYLIPEAVKALERLRSTYESKTKQHVLFSQTRSGFRSYEDQEASWERNIKEPYKAFYARASLLVHELKVAVPGFSQHGTGAAVDLQLELALNQTFRKLAFDAGFIRSEIRVQWRKDRFETIWVDRPHFLYVGLDDEAIEYLSVPKGPRGLEPGDRGPEDRGAVRGSSSIDG